MMSQGQVMPLGVFTSLGVGYGAGLDKVKALGLPTVQVHAPPVELLTREHAAEVKQQFAEAGIAITLVFCGFPGESYADIPTSKRTVGLVPRETREERILLARKIADYARWLDSPGIGIHIGFIDEDHNSAGFKELVGVTQELCGYCQKLGLGVNLETGQEPADTLLAYIDAVGAPNLFVNFDPANMILYGSGEPIAALRQVARHVRSVHVKDGTWSDQPTVTFGTQVPLGEGAVGMENYLRTLVEIGYTGPLTIEREIKEDGASAEEQLRDIRDAVKLLEELKAKLGVG